MNIPLGTLIIYNALAFCIMGYDKFTAVRNGAATAAGGGQPMRRVPEKSLLAIAFCLGAAGIFAGMVVFRHKTQKPLFKIFVPFAFVVNLVALFYINGNL